MSGPVELGLLSSVGNSGEIVVTWILNNFEDKVYHKGEHVHRRTVQENEHIMWKTENKCWTFTDLEKEWENLDGLNKSKIL
jgi:hypothetical protein